MNAKLLKPYQPVVLDLIQQSNARLILDAPSGSGWLPHQLTDDYQVDGVDLFADDISTRYHQFFKQDMNAGIPKECPLYDCIVSCEGLEHLFAPSVFLQAARRHLKPEGVLIITTPNVWYPSAKLQYFLRGFFPSFPSLVGKIQPGTHMHLTPWSFPQLFLILSLLGFRNITLHPTLQPAPKHLYEYLLGFPQSIYCRLKQKNAIDKESAAFWKMAGSPASLYARGLVISATA